MKLSQLRKKAEAMIAKGAADYARRVGDPVDTAVAINRRTGETKTLSVRRRSVTHEEFSRTYDDARDLLLKHGYVKSQDAKVQALYAELIPDSPNLKIKKKTVLKDLRSRTESKRRAAVEECSRAARGVGKIGWDQWPKNPIVVESLLNALAKEKSTKIAESLIASLACIHSRYYADSRIPPALFALYDSDDREIRQTAIGWTSHMRDRGKWQVILAILEAKPTVSMLETALSHLDEKTPVGVKRKLCPILITTADRKLNRDAKTSLHLAILNMIDERTAVEYETALQGNKKLSRELKKLAKQWFGEGHDRYEFLQANVFG